MSNTSEEKCMPNSKCNEDSFDAEFDLLESTLSELKDNEPFGASRKEHCNNPKNNIPVSSDLLNCDSSDINKSQPCNSQTLGLSCSPELVPTSIDSSNLIVSSSIQHLESSNKSKSTSLNGNLTHRVDQHLISDCKDYNPCTKSIVVKVTNSNQTDISKYNFKGCNNNDVVVSNCDSSMEEQKDLKEVCDFSARDMPRYRNRDLNLNPSEMLKLESPPLPSTGSSTISDSPGFVVKTLEEGLEENIVVQTSVGYKSVHDSGSNKGSYDLIQPPIVSSFDVTSNQESNVEQISTSDIGNTFSTNCIDRTKVQNPIEGELKEGSIIYCSTPVSSKERPVDIPTQREEKDDGDFGYISPLDKAHMKKKLYLKRKNLGLECIQEVDENLSDIPLEKKLKIESLQCKNDESNVGNESDTVSAKPCFETPAKSILKKWQPSFFSRSSAGSFFILDECESSDIERDVNASEENAELAALDDFEIAYKSLTEELIKSTSNNIECLEKYYSQVQYENQLDDEKFDEVINELTLNHELDEKTSVTLGIVDISVETDHQNESVEIAKEEITEQTNLNKEVNKNNEGGKAKCGEIILHSGKDKNGTKLLLKEGSPAESSSNEEVPSSSKDKLLTPAIDNLTVHNTDGNVMTRDEEDILLEGDTDPKKKPYEFFEFVSTDPKENEDNYNPEWQKLGRLTSDEERYKAVRDRWRSLVPPDPNRDLTCRQWREKNHLPALNLQSLNNNHQLYVDSKRNQLCTAVFEQKIKKLAQELKDSRDNLCKKRYKAFQDLAIIQDKEQGMLTSRGANKLDMIMMNKHHIEECCQLRDTYNQELKRVTTIIDEKIIILKNASEEVLLFQKFYKGVGASDDKACLYMTDTEVQELMETEQMLEQYSKFYK